MSKFIFSELSRERLNSIVKIEDKGFVAAKWNQSISECTAREKEKIQLIQEYSLNYQLSLMNEATIWARTIYPLLMLAESGNIQAWAEVSLAGKYPHFEMEGIVDGVLGRLFGGGRGKMWVRSQKSSISTVWRNVSSGLAQSATST